MDKGAHFYRADFQVHSPRDLNWAGSRPVADDARLEFAREFIRECRQKGIQAAAITDHHDVCFIKYYQYAAQEDKEASYSPNPSFQNTVIFPGVELTLRIPCQAIVLLDAGADSVVQHTLLTVCGVPSHPESEASGPKVEALPFDNLKELEDRLNENPVLKGRFIILPNVSCSKSGSGYKSLLRKQGFNAKYAAMPCVGGYIECDWDEQDKRNVLEGQDKEWGNKALGVFQTSDSRREDLSDLGLRTSWVKMSIPTAESLRQACLARKSRIHQAEPQTPSVYIRRLQVTNSTFLGPIDIELTTQFNALIGGRGTGKTSILEYVRHAMQDQPAEDSEDQTVHDEITQKRARIIQTLKDKNGSVTVEWVKNGVPHVVTLADGTSKPALKVGAELPVETTPDELRSILPLQAYSQKQLSTVGTRERELRRFIEQPIQGILAKCNDQISEKRRYIGQVYERLSDLTERDRSLSGLRVRLRSIQEQVRSLEESLPKLSQLLEKALKEHPLRLREKAAIDDIEADFLSARTAVEVAIQTITGLPRPLTLDDESPQKNLIMSAHANLASMFDNLRRALIENMTYLEQQEKAISTILTSWQANQDEHEKLYKTAEEGAKEHKQKLDLIKQLRTQEADLKKQISELEKQVVDLPSVRKEFDGGWRSWLLMHRERGDALEGACRELTEKSEGEIQAELERGSDYSNALAGLKDILRGCNIRDTNWDTLEEFLIKDGPANAWMKLMEGLRPLAELTKEDLPPDGRVPEIPCWPLTPAMRKNIVERLKPTRRWLDVALTSLQDLPVFYYKPGEGQRIKFEKASAGQQATALIRVLLKETAGPLIIDQPEDDLDNETIQRIAEGIWTAKERRQIIFASHNANVVVNGDAELVIHCAYREEGERTKGHIALEGSIDVPDIRQAIQRVMEGGREAFELRRQKYGF